MIEDLERRAALHESASLWEGAPPYCVACSFEEGESLPDDVPWPCLVHELATALTAEQAQLMEVQARIMALELVAQAARDFATVVGPRGGYLTAYTALEDALAVLAALDTDA